MVQSNFRWLAAIDLNREVDGKLRYATDYVECEHWRIEQRERYGPSISSSSAQPMNIRDELMHAETHGLKVRRRPGPGNPPESEKYEHNATDLRFRVGVRIALPE